MKKHFGKRILSLMLATVLLAGVVFSANWLPTLASDTLFSDDFSSSALSGWKSQDVGSVKSGKYHLSGQVVNSAVAVKDLLNNKISADVAVTVGADTTGAIQTSMASIVLCADSDLNSGYEFGIGVSKQGTTFVRLYLRGNEDVTRILEQKTTEIPGTDKGKIVIGQEYHLTIGAYEGLIQCFINNELVFSFEDKTYTTGYCGLRNTWANSTFDNVLVEKIEDKKVKTLELKNPPSVLSALAELTFDVFVTYEGDYHQSELIPANDSRLTIKGLSRTQLGKRKVYVSYGGKTVKFSVEIVDTTGDELVYSDDYATDKKDNYTYYETQKSDYNLTYGFKIKNGKLMATVPSLPQGFNSPVYAKSTMEVDEIKDLKLYYASVDAVIYSDMATPTARKGIAELSAFTDAYGHAYSMRVYSTGTIELRCGSSVLSSTSISALEGASFEKGKTFKMSMYVSEQMLICQYNGIDVFYYSSAYMENYTPRIYVVAYNGNITFDNLQVYSMAKYVDDAVRSIKVLTSTTKEPITTYKGRSFDYSKLCLQITYMRGHKRVIGLTEDMISGYNDNLKQDQTIIITCGSVTKKLPFKYLRYLFYDDFEGSSNPQWKLNLTESLSGAVKNGQFKTTWDGNTSSSGTLATMIVEGSEEWSDYSVSVDVSFDQSMTKYTLSSSYYSLILRRTGNTYYDFRMITRSGDITMYLYEYINGKSTQVGQYKTSYLISKLGGAKAIENGSIFNMKAVCRGETIYLYLDDVLIGTHIGTDENAPRKGYVGMKLSKASGMIDNFIVDEKSPEKIVKLGIAELQDNVFEVYEGFDIDAYDYTLNRYDADGTVMQERLTPAMLSPFDNLEVGVQNITITAYGMTQRAKVRVMQREDYIAQVEQSLKDLKISSITIDDVEFVEEILNRYDELSGYEITKLSKKAVTNATKVRNHIHELKYPETADSDVIASNFFTEEDDCNADDWSRGAELGSISRGEWLFVNGNFRMEQELYGISAASYRVYKPVYGEITSVSARFKLLSSGMYAGVALNASRQGNYLARVKMDTFDDDGNVIPMFQVMKAGTRIYSEAFSALGVTVKENEWFEVCLTCKDGVVSAYINGTLIFAFNDSESIESYTVGRTGVHLANGNGKVDNFVVHGVLKEEPVSEAVPTPTEYVDNFDDEQATKNPDYWVEQNLVDKWKVFLSGENKIYGNAGSSEFTESWLHVFEKNPTVSMDFQYAANAKDADIGFYVRKAPDTAYVKVGYDYAQKKWYVLETQAERDDAVNITYSEETFLLKEKDWHSIKIVAADKYVTVSVDGKNIFDKLKVSQYGYGRIGVYSKGAVFYIDNVKCEFPNGDIPQDGVLDYTMNPDFYDGGVDVQNLDGKNMIGFGIYGAYYSTDGGESFDVIGGPSAAAEDVVEEYKELTQKQGYKSIHKLHDGSYLFVYANDMVARKSTDNGKTWKTIGNVISTEELKDASQRRMVTIHCNSITEYQLEDGTWRIFLPVAFTTYAAQLSVSVSGHYTVVYYSDDGGVTWQASKDDTRDIAVDCTDGDVTHEWAEMKIVQCSDGSMRLYLTRSDYGCIQYTVSHDNGITWEGHYQIPEMQCAMSSYSITQDTASGTYYMVWVNNTPVSRGSAYSRTRLSLARSLDGMNWEFVCDLERMSEEIYGTKATVSSPIMQIVDPCIHVDEDYVYVTYGRSESSDTAITNHNGLRVRMARIEKDEIEVRKWDASNISDMLFTKSIEVTKPFKLRYGYGDLFSHADGEVTVTRMDGTTEIINTRTLHLLEEPDMFALGKQTVKLYNSYGMQTSYEIEVVNKYNVNWTVTGEGTIEPQDRYVLEGDTLSSKIRAKNFFYKAVVTVNEQNKELKAGKLVCENVTEHLDITVNFVKKGFFDYLAYVILLLVILGVGAFAVICIVKKKRPKELLVLIKGRIKRGKKNAH